MTTRFSKLIKGFIDSNNLIADGDVVIVGLSGGADSVALLSVLLELQCNVIATHCNFHLRGKESMRDEAHCRKLCDELGVELMTVDFDVDSRRKEYGESVEMACRALRYDWWAKLMDDGVGNVIAVGHHREDNIETFFLNLLRGSSLTGLKGMLPRNGKVIRPLLDAPKSEILKYLQARNLGYVTDSSNLDNIYKRNRLRNKVLPFLEAEFPGAIGSIASTLSHLRDNYKLYSDFRRELCMKYVSDDGKINLAGLCSKEHDPRVVLYELISDNGFNMSQAENMLCCLEDKDSVMASGKLFIGRNMDYLFDRGILIPISKEKSEPMKLHEIDLLESPFCYRLLTRDEFETMRDRKELKANAFYADNGTLFNGDPVFHMRGWRRGDRMKPFGLNGSKLLSDIFSNMKMSIHDKNKVVVVTRDSDIIWVPGVKCSSLYPVTSQTEIVIEIVYMPLES